MRSMGATSVFGGLGGTINTAETSSFSPCFLIGTAGSNLGAWETELFQGWAEPGAARSE